MKYVLKNTFYRILIPIFDLFGSLVFFPIKSYKKPPANPKNILVVRLDHIGDFVCTTPVIKNIKKLFPKSKITVLINSASKDIAYRDPDIDKVITFSPFYLSRGDRHSTTKGLMRVVKDVRSIGFDMGIEPRGDLLSILIMWLGGVRYRIGYGITGGGFLLNWEGRYDSSSHVIDRNLSLLNSLGLNSFDRSPALYFNENDMSIVDDVISELKINKDRSIILHPFAGATTREWHRDNFQKLIDHFTKEGMQVLLIGTRDESGGYPNVIDVRGRLNLPQLIYFIKIIGRFIGLNSGPANIAAALNVPSVIISSGTNIVEHWITDNPNVRFVYKDVSCRPCERKVCPKEKYECMDGITVEEVLNKFKEVHEGIF